jgi:spore coat polysaccharide biosynthesis protein SpsF (cytidylyltransferase family)
MRSPVAVVILQARMGSSRLPGKALQLLAGRSLVGWCLDRLRCVREIPVMLATTTRREDDVLEREAAARGIKTFRGPVHDVLRRLLFAAASMGARYVIRATGDNPAVDIDAPARLLRILTNTRADYVVERGLPCGAAVEAVSVQALRRADARAADPADREHVTTVIRRESAVFNTLEVPAPAHLRRPDLRLTIDTPEDLRFMRDVLSRLDRSKEEPSLAAIIAAADEVLTGTVTG